MSDRELLELAARAADLQLIPFEEAPLLDTEGQPFWNPLADDGDAFRLAAALNFTLDFERGVVWGAGELDEQALGRTAGHGCMRRAIVCAAALVGAQAQYAEQIEAGIAAADAGHLTDIDLVKSRWLERRPGVKVDATKS